MQLKPPNFVVAQLNQTNRSPIRKTVREDGVTLLIEYYSLDKKQGENSQNCGSRRFLQIHLVFPGTHPEIRNYWPWGRTGVRRYGCIPRSAANNSEERVFLGRECIGTRPCLCPSHFGIRLYFLLPHFPFPTTTPFSGISLRISHLCLVCWRESLELVPLRR